MTAMALTGEERSRVLAAARAAPAMCGGRPWNVTFAAGSVDIAPDMCGAGAEEPAAPRACHLACGAAAFNAQLALNHLGYTVRVRALPPPTALAVGGVQLEITGRGHDAELEELFAALRLRRVDAPPVPDRPIAEALLDDLRAAAARAGAVLRVVTAVAERQRLLALLRSAVAGAASRAGDELPEWLASGREAERAERTATLAVLGTRRDDCGTWIRSGAALQRVLLVGAAGGAAFSLAYRALEHPELRPSVAAAIRYFGHPQIVLRIGYPATDTPSPPPRPVPSGSHA